MVAEAPNTGEAVPRWLDRAPEDPVMSAAARGLAVDLVVEVDGERHVLRLSEPCTRLPARPLAPIVAARLPDARCWNPVARATSFVSVAVLPASPRGTVVVEADPGWRREVRFAALRTSLSELSRPVPAYARPQFAPGTGRQ